MVSGTIYLRARYYNADLGRFTQQDGWEFVNPKDPLSLNLYMYCGNNPIVYVDPIGNDRIHFMITVHSAHLMMAIYNYLKNRKIDTYNRMKEITIESGYITEQSEMTDFKFGLSNMADGGCGAIALYNARIALQDTRPIRDIIFYCDMYGEYALGYLGAKSSFVADYFELYGYDVHTLYAWDRDLYNEYAEQYDVAILLYVLEGATVRQHYITIVKNENEKYQAYNHNTIGGEEFDSMSELIDATKCEAVVSLTFIR